jgi:hypothetical protein
MAGLKSRKGLERICCLPNNKESIPKVANSTDISMSQADRILSGKLSPFFEPIIIPANSACEKPIHATVFILQNYNINVS